MRRRALRVGILGATMVALAGCSAPPNQPAVEVAPALPAVPALQNAAEFGASGTAFEVQQRRGRRYRFRRIHLGGRSYYVPYFAYQGYYLPNYLRYDPQWYYVYVYTGPNFTGSRRLIRIRRDRDRDRDWNDRSDWNRIRNDDWRDGERDDDDDRGRRGRR